MLVTREPQPLAHVSRPASIASRAEALRIGVHTSMYVVRWDKLQPHVGERISFKWKKD